MRIMKWVNLFSIVAVMVVLWSWSERSVVAAEEESAAEEPDPSTLPGVVLTRPDGSYMTVELEQPKLVFRFYDFELNPIAADVDRAAFRVFGPGRDLERYIAIKSDDGMMLRHGRPIRGPWVFRVYINLFREGSDEAVENYTISFPADKESEAEEE